MSKLPYYGHLQLSDQPTSVHVMADGAYQLPPLSPNGAKRSASVLRNLGFQLIWICEEPADFFGILLISPTEIKHVTSPSGAIKLLTTMQ